MRYKEVMDTVTYEQAAEILGLASKSAVIYRVRAYNIRHNYGDEHPDRLCDRLRLSEVELLRDAPDPGRPKSK